MALWPAIIRDPGEEDVTPAERKIYKCMIAHLDSGTSPIRAGLRCSQDCGVSRTRVMEIMRKVNPEWMP